MTVRSCRPDAILGGGGSGPVNRPRAIIDTDASAVNNGTNPAAEQSRSAPQIWPRIPLSTFADAGAGARLLGRRTGYIRTPLWHLRPSRRMTPAAAALRGRVGNFSDRGPRMVHAGKGTRDQTANQQHRQQSVEDYAHHATLARQRPRHSQIIGPGQAPGKPGVSPVFWLVGYALAYRGRKIRECGKCDRTEFGVMAAPEDTSTT